MKKIISAVLALRRWLYTFTRLRLQRRRRRARHDGRGLNDIGSAPRFTPTSASKKVQSRIEWLPMMKNAAIWKASYRRQDRQRCAFLHLYKTLPAGSGHDREIHNINYCHGGFVYQRPHDGGYCRRAGDRERSVPVSGTGALTGAYKAYEDITGNSLSS
jgi:hypothetical protein